MDTFRSISWSVPIEEVDFATPEEFKCSSIAYKMLHSQTKIEISSDSSDEPLKPAKSKKCCKKKKKKNVGKESKVHYYKSHKKNDESSELWQDGKRFSKFTAVQHEYFVNMLQAVQSQKLPILPEWKEMIEAVEKEQIEFFEFIKELWKTSYEKHHVLPDGARKFTEDIWKIHLKKVKLYPKFYSTHKEIPLVYPANMPEVQMVPIKILLEMGVVPKFYPPLDSLSNKITTEYTTMLLLNTCSSENSNTLLNTPVSYDRNAEILAVRERADIVISSSSLKCIADNVPSNYKTTWDIPIAVKQYTVKDGSSETSHTVVFVDKKLPPKTISTSERNTWYHKQAVKCLMCHHRDPTSFRYPENEFIDMNVNFSRDERTDCCKDLEVENVCCNCQLPICPRDSECVNDDDDDDDDDNLVIDDDSFLVDCKDSKEQNTPQICSCSKRDPKRDLHQVCVPPSSKTNVIYRLWKLYFEERSKEDLNEKFLKGQNSRKEIKVIVRCKIDACEQEKEVQLICLSSKLEYQAEYGVEKVNASSLAREWTSLFIRPEATLRRLRINAMTEEVIMVEKILLRDLAQKALLQYGLHIRKNVLGSLYQVFSNLISLKPKYYLLKHNSKNGPFAHLMQNTDQVADLDLHGEYGAVNPDLATEDNIPQWVPIDTNLLTPKHIMEKQIPGTFQPVRVEIS